MAPDEAPPKHPGGRPTKYDPCYCEEIVEWMARGYSLVSFGGKIKVARRTITEWCQVHTEFAEAVEIGKASQLQSWEERMINVGDGKGGPGASTVVTFALRNLGGTEWQDKQVHELTGKGGGPIVTVTKIERIIVRPPNPDG